MDTIANFLTSVKNANMAGKPTVTTPFSKMNAALAELLEKGGYVGEVSKKTRKNRKYLEMALLYENGKAKIRDIDRVSKPSRRLYSKSKNIHSYRQGLGMHVLSTSKGVLTDKEAKAAKVGGEVLFRIW